MNLNLIVQVKSTIFKINLLNQTSKVNILDFTLSVKFEFLPFL